MAILGQIRKRSIFLIIVIGMALFAFVISGVFTSNGGFNSNVPIGEINGEKIDYELFNMMVDQAQNLYGLNTINAVNLAWDQSITNETINQELDKLGIDAGKNQLEQIISSDPSIVSNPLFQNEIGLFDFSLFSNYVNQLKSTNPNLYQSWKSQEDRIISLARQKIYFDLIKSSILYTNVESNIQYHLENDKVNFQYLLIPYELVPDSVINVKDSEIRSFLKSNKEKYEQPALRKINYVFIEDLPSEMDVSNIRTNLEQLRDGFSQFNQITNTVENISGFKEVDDYVDFIEIYSDENYEEIYKTKQDLNGDFSDILFGLEIGQVFGPYIDDGYYKISRMIDKKREDNLNKVLLADVMKELVPSNESSNNNYRKASQAEYDANNDLALNFSNQDIFIDSYFSNDEFDSGIPGYDNTRQVVKWLYEKNSKVGDVRRFNLNTGYLVAQIIEFKNETLPSVDEVKDEISNIILNEKKYDYLEKKYRDQISIENLINEFNIELQSASAVTQNDPILVGAGNEPYIIGSAFSLDDNEISGLLKGNNGIYVINVLSKEIAEEINIESAISNSLSDREIERISTLVIDVIESNAKIVDNRSFYY
tara:strand:+ start:5427 stop:7214 length:1788 start_codon:yes stop_codon:yes gene_type:complete